MLIEHPGFRASIWSQTDLDLNPSSSIYPPGSEGNFLTKGLTVFSSEMGILIEPAQRDFVKIKPDNLDMFSE